MNQLHSYQRAFKYKPLVYKIVTYSVSHSSASPLSWDSQCKSLASSASQYHLQIPEKQITEHSYNSSSYRLKSHCLILYRHCVSQYASEALHILNPSTMRVWHVSSSGSLLPQNDVLMPARYMEIAAPHRLSQHVSQKDVPDNHAMYTALAMKMHSVTSATELSKLTIWHTEIFHIHPFPSQLII